MDESPSGTSRVDDPPANEFRAGLPARDAAVALLDSVLTRGKTLDATLASQSHQEHLAALESRDRALVRAITATTLRRLGQLDALTSAFLERPLPKSTGPLRHILRAALAQILFMETPVHAVVDLAVHQTKANARSKRFDRLVNAVLRRAAREGAAITARQDAAKLNTPAWIWTRWATQYGETTARAIATSHLNEAPLDLSVKTDAEGWAGRLGGYVLPTGSVRLVHKGRTEALDGYDEGAWWVQDAAAALPASFLGDVTGKTIADLCAAPGGKTAQLASFGAHVVAVDISRKRLEWVSANLKRLGLQAQCIAADATTWQPEEKVDAVLLDAPCLSTGTIRRHPDIPHLKRPSDLDKLTKLQQRLLANAITLVKPGGRLVYCTCSLEAEECEAQIDRLTARERRIEIEPIAAKDVAERADWLTPQGYLRTLPHHLGDPCDGPGGIDGFFAARLLVVR